MGRGTEEEGASSLCLRSCCGTKSRTADSAELIGLDLGSLGADGWGWVSQESRLGGAEQFCKCASLRRDW